MDIEDSYNIYSNPLFDNYELCRELAQFPIPVITGIGHEDDLTVADLVADHRAATPSAAIVSLLPSRSNCQNEISIKKTRLKEQFIWILKSNFIIL